MEMMGDLEEVVALVQVVDLAAVVVVGVSEAVVVEALAVVEVG